MKKVLLIPLLLTIFIRVNAQDSTSKEEQGFSIHGSVDLYCQGAMGHGGKENPAFTYNFRKLGTISNNLAVIKATYKKQKWTASLSLMEGDYSRFNLSAEPAFWRRIYEASINYQINKEWSMQAGVFPSHIGMETAIAKDNWNLSRSLVAENSPYYETGIRLNRKSKNDWVFSLLLLNGWQHIKDNNDVPAIGTQIQGPVGKKVTFNSSGFIGKEGPDSARRMRLFHDLYLSWNISEKDKLAMILDIGAQKNLTGRSFDSWWGTALLYQHVFSRKWAMGARAELYRDIDQIIISLPQPGGKTIKGLAINIDHSPLNWLQIRSEARILHSGTALAMADQRLIKTNITLTGGLCFYF